MFSVLQSDRAKVSANSALIEDEKSQGGLLLRKLALLENYFFAEIDDITHFYAICSHFTAAPGNHIGFDRINHGRCAG